MVEKEDFWLKDTETNKFEVLGLKYEFYNMFGLALSLSYRPWPETGNYYKKHSEEITADIIEVVHNDVLRRLKSVTIKIII